MARSTLPGPDYFDANVFATDQERIFRRSWYVAGRAETAPAPGNWFTVDVAGESILVVRGDDDVLRGFYNVCRHRGARLRDAASGHDKGVIACGYHAWCYRFSGELAATPRIGKDELDRESNGLIEVHCDVWEGFVFVNLDPDAPTPLRQWLGELNSDILGFERWDMGSLRVHSTREWIVEANWKILIENYLECLHCPTVHPELVEAVPAYRTGWVYEEGRTDGGVSNTSRFYGSVGSSTIATLPTMTEVEAESIYGALFYPHAFLDIAGTGVQLTVITPIGPTTCREVTYFLFHPDAMSAPDFDPQGVLDFSALVTEQDNAVCEMVQRGVRSAAFRDGGVYPDKDEFVWAFNQRYLAQRDGVSG